MRAARRSIFLYLFRLRIEASEKTARVVRIPDDIVTVDGNAPGTGLGVRQRVLGDLHGLWIDTADLAGGEQIEERNPLRVHLDPVWHRARTRGFLQRHVACFRIELADEVAALDGEPERSVLRKNRRVRIARRRIGHLEFRNVSGFGIELRNGSGRVCRVPDVAVPIRDKAVWAVTSGKIELTKLTRCHVNASEFVRSLPAVPQRIARAKRRVVRKRVRRRDSPVVKRNLYGVVRRALSVNRNSQDACQYGCAKNR